VWTTPDPIGVLGGVNLYGYAGNNPVNLTDLLGLTMSAGELGIGNPGSYGGENTGASMYGDTDRGDSYDNGNYYGVNGDVDGDGIAEKGEPYFDPVMATLMPLAETLAEAWNQTKDTYQGYFSEKELRERQSLYEPYLNQNSQQLGDVFQEYLNYPTSIGDIITLSFQNGGTQGTNECHGRGFERK
jgi:hypothetical protein